MLHEDERDYLQEFTQLMDGFSTEHSTKKRFNDFLSYAMCPYSKENSVGSEDEPPYMQPLKPYGKKGLQVFPQLLAMVQLQALDNPRSDLLGDYYLRRVDPSEGAVWADRLQRSVNNLKPQQARAVLDPACGSGLVLLDIASRTPENRFYGADSRELCAKMAALNLCMRGLSGEVSWMKPSTADWFASWRINIDGNGIEPISLEESDVCFWCMPPPVGELDKMVAGVDYPDKLMVL